MNRFQICTAASHLIDGEAIQSFEGGKEEEIFGDLWTWVPRVIQRDHFWNFNEAEAALVKDLASPTDPNWLYRYAKPAADDDHGDFLRPIRATDANGYRVEFKERGDKILRNSPTLRLTYQYDRIETEWPGDFLDYAIKFVAQHACEALNGEGNVHDRLVILTDRARQNAIFKDSKKNGGVTQVKTKNARWLGGRY